MDTEKPVSVAGVEEFVASTQSKNDSRLYVPLQEEIDMSPGKKHPFHLVDPSPWPFVSSLSILILAIGAVLWMHKIDYYLFL